MDFGKKAGTPIQCVSATFATIDLIKSCLFLLVLLFWETVFIYICTIVFVVIMSITKFVNSS
ncbi:hypothetical protein CW304_28810 [Bacillus sp. UFRGS-B20]|nr:hypothetical protein CW304_28810 [Bacillus sp. UFRGS-B20]